MAMFESRSYLQKEIIDSDHFDMHLATFYKFLKREKNFPKPFFVSGNRKKWDGTAQQFSIGLIRSQGGSTWHYGQYNSVVFYS